MHFATGCTKIFLVNCLLFVCTLSDKQHGASQGMSFANMLYNSIGERKPISSALFLPCGHFLLLAARALIPPHPQRFTMQIYNFFKTGVDGYGRIFLL